MQASTLMKVFAAGALATTCAAGAYLQDQEPFAVHVQAQAQAQPLQQVAPVIDLGRMFDAARR